MVTTTLCKSDKRMLAEAAVDNVTTTLSKSDKHRMLAEAAADIWFGRTSPSEPSNNLLRVGANPVVATLATQLPKATNQMREKYITLVAHELSKDKDVEDSTDYTPETRILQSACGITSMGMVPCKTIVKIDAKEFTLTTWKAYGVDEYKYKFIDNNLIKQKWYCLLYTSPSPRD